MGKVLVPIIRSYAEGDFEPLVRYWHQTNRASYRYVDAHQRHTLANAKGFFRMHVLAECEVWVAVDSTKLLGLTALQIPWVRQLAVFAPFQRRGVGSALLGKALERSPSQLRLFTFQRNEPARAFYEKRGFEAVAWGVSPFP